MKTALELPDELFRQDKMMAASNGQSLKDFFAEALRAKLTAPTEPHIEPWVRHFGFLKHLGRILQIEEDLHTLGIDGVTAGYYSVVRQELRAFSC